VLDELGHIWRNQSNVLLKIDVTGEPAPGQYANLLKQKVIILLRVKLLGHIYRLLWPMIPLDDDDDDDDKFVGLSFFNKTD